MFAWKTNAGYRVPHATRDSGHSISPPGIDLETKFEIGREDRSVPDNPKMSEPSPSIEARLAASTSLAVFCDFDGTYSVQDVGSTLARKYLGERRIELWSRYEAGEFTPWEYNLELFTGFALPARAVHAFLETIELDSGARALQAWCEEQAATFRILSDGFDYNLDRLQGLNGVKFDYVANHLEYEGDGWKIAPGHPNPDCECGTGTCKRSIIEARRLTRPGSFCVHIGNGRVSDLCGCEAADLAFAKDSLAPALEERGVAYEYFDTLNDVVSILEGLLARAREFEAASQ